MQMVPEQPAIGYRPGRSAQNNVIAFLEGHRQRTPQRPALVWATQAGSADAAANLVHGRMSYGELAAAAESVAAGLHELGLGAGDRVLLFIPMSPALYVAMFAVQRLGAIAVFLDSWARRHQLGHCARLVAPRAFIGPEAAFALVAGIPELETAAVRVVVGPHQGRYEASLEALVAAGGSCPLHPVAGEETALVTFTTGSSGEPKGANRTHRFLAAQHYALAQCLPYRADDVDLPAFPIFALNNLAGGVTTVLPAVDLARPGERDGELLAAQIRAEGVTCCTLSPSLLRQLAAAAGRQRLPLDGLRRVATGGAPVSADDVAAIRAAAPAAEVHILYGSTEVEPIAHLLAAQMPASDAGEGVCVGEISAGLDCRLLRLQRGPIELGEGGWGEWESPPGEPGELVVSGEHVCRDYFANAEAFRAAKIVDGEGRVWHRTGDVCRFDPQGRLWIVGRVHNAICRAGRLLFPVGPEIVMKRLPFVAAAAYLGLPDAELGERAVAAFSVLPGNRPADCGDALRQALAANGVVVDEVVAVAEIPLDPRHHSKVEYGRLREALLARGGER